MGGYGVRADHATAPRPVEISRGAAIATLAALAGAGFRRFATYRQATVAAAVTNSVFGFLRCYVLLATLAGSGAAMVAGYDAGQLALYCWMSQGLIGVVGLWGWTELGDRIRSGDVVADLVRPVHPVLSYLAVDLGRAAHGALTRFTVPLLVGALAFPMHAPERLTTYPLFVVSTVLAVLVSFFGRYVMNAAGFWLLDVRGVTTFWLFATTVLAGLMFPLHFLPDRLTTLIWVATPFPSMLQAPLDVATERGPAVVLIAGQAVWAAALLGLCWAVQGRAERKLVIQGG
jgi:ABC-2 type transport system permease protein